MPIITANGVDISCTDTGAPTDAPDTATVVFGHGLLFGGWMFRAQVAALAGRYRCVTLDWRGQGDTPPTAGGYDMDALTADAAAVIRALGVAPVHWVGLSMGGFVGQRLAARHSGLLRSLTLLGTSAAAEEPARATEYRRLARIQCLTGIRPLAGRVLPHLFGPAFLADPANRPLLDEWHGRLRRTSRAAVRKAVLGVADREPVVDELARIVVPTLVMVGADDRTTPPDEAERITACIPGARLYVIPDCGHSSPLEQPGTVTRFLTAFLTTADAVA